MGQKVNPIGFRLSVRRDWQSRWFANKKEFGTNLKEDYQIRSFLEEKFRYAAVPRIFIERAGNRVRIKVFTARPGIVIGRKGAELEKIKESLGKLISRDVILDIQEVKKPDLVAQLVAESVALQLERRISFRRAMKKTVQSTMSVGAKGDSSAGIRATRWRGHCTDRNRSFRFCTSPYAPGQH
jgi:small subunit ribosomal protein S3